ncbi:MAG: hypothetical protein AB1814_11655 [Thermodesulfobacteriota bacterium]
MAQENGWVVFAQVASPIVALALGVAGVWNEKIKNWLFGPRLELEVHEPLGHYTHTTRGQTMRYYLIRVRNKPNKMAALKVCVRLASLHKLNADGTEEDRSPSIPLLLEQSSNLGTHVDVRSYDAFNIGFMGGLADEPEKFLLQVHKQFFSFQGKVAPEERMKIGLELQAENLAPSKTKHLMLAWQPNQQTSKCPWPSIPVLSLVS